MADPKQTEVLRQLHAAWDQAQAQLVELRSQVEQATALAQAKVKANFLENDLDRAFRDLGEAVWNQVQKGKLALPSGLSAAQKAVAESQKKLDRLRGDLSDLIKEGEEAASRLKGKGKKR